jgi:YidC/Oxa1 family membrane protein insertase
MSTLFHLILTQPLFNLLVVLYKYVTFADLGLAIIALTIVVRFALYPIFYKGLKSQMVMQKIQPEITKAQQENKGDKEKQAKALMDVYKRNKVNPFSSILYVFAQLPLLIAIYRIFLQGLNEDSFKNLYSFVSAPEVVNHQFLGILDISQPSMIIVALAVIAQYYQSKTAMAKQTSATAAPMMKYMMYIGPLLTLLILPKLPAAIGLYWLTTSVFSIFQQLLINKQLYGAQATGKD